ncbi:MAG: hypothetical protein UR90_C0007G0022 [Parcubacteria group bacterium GW2011_GWC1_35_8]|uniref:Uncharacterized protein n=1 Tax=Candidatus Nomurabacteria bacterium RIFOXYC2_FULL_36_19 TaxID=1801806 RepID=A0A1F6YV56_9BACT|nr:MAG: hypothetical protein UR90_C0007G0022 [Parcubacteria group bacterium GW2011_GWC1_35_8]OGJ05501.1 MAG: hypothetical protein A2238_02465 [Candidatus Nomurabacteria bacterium RIFOXYA2_FULL_35_9]OGJ10238.1 MAG: hypothetical protein A2456_03190 [Candidatus Nomurabacteria bacterium RIFOXYC2_FULL_36_19]OGJ14285.1 MAG: hypothetical protein A2554_00745 [Candidatus Nomurabacteria bacterium RIFOXYD2_FULL_35_12]
MDQNFQTSFIPKKPIIEERTVPARSVNFFTIISIFLLFTVLIVTGGLYFYKGILATDITKKENDLNLAKNRFEPSKITELQLLDKRLRSSTEILSRHIAISPIFRVLSDITMKTVRYTKFSYNIGTEKDTKVTVKMSGQAVGYRSVALQSDLFVTKEEGKNFIDPVFSNLSLDDKGNVLFDLEFLVDPSFVDYKQMILTQS